ncbi:FMN-binding protein [Microbacterium foliorum]|uniref:FMN-binding protein n=1 Tax=Microbacterium foliorum TaxID=104336 RepID=UPI0028D33481|nr:FMN-binding protein [Microbacterium foliorum]
MIRTTVPTSVRKGAAIAGVAGLLVLAGCSGTADAEDSSTGTGTGTTAETDAPSTGDYADGTYTADGSYQTPETVESVSVTLTIADGVVKDVKVTGDPKARETEQYQGQFIKGISDEVVGKSLDDLKVDRVAGSSLTSGGFNEAVASIKEQAAA